MAPITHYIPKALVEVDGKPLINHVFDMVGDVKKYVTYGHKSDVLFNVTRLVVDGYINTTTKDNSYFLYNSFVKHIDEPIIVSPCDMIMEIDLEKVYEDYIKLGSPAIMVVGVEPVDGIDGDFIEYDENNTIVSLTREKVTDKYCSGLQIINPFKVNDITADSDNFYDVWQQLRYMGELKVSNILPTKWKCYDEIKSII
jgi:NDP-sugar pyrophosphorylase family protein